MAKDGETIHEIKSGITFHDVSVRSKLIEWGGGVRDVEFHNEPSSAIRTYRVSAMKPDSTLACDTSGYFDRLTSSAFSNRIKNNNEILWLNPYEEASAKLITSLQKQSTRW